MKRRTIRYGECSADGVWTWGVVKGNLAIGSGAPYALAAWDVLDGFDVSDDVRMRMALRAAAKHCASVRGPFDLVWA